MECLALCPFGREPKAARDLPGRLEPEVAASGNRQLWRPLARRQGEAAPTAGWRNRLARRGESGGASAETPLRRAAR
jgi:hypothetical protein